MEPTAGLFWLPETPGEKIPGRLSLTEDGSPQVELFDHITPSMKLVHHDPATNVSVSEPADDPPSFTVHGFVDTTPRAVSLFRCYTPSRSELHFVRTPLRKQTVQATYAFRGDDHIQDEQVAFDAVCLRVSGIDAWAALPGFDSRTSEGEDFVVRLKEIEEPSINLSDELVLGIVTDAMETGEFFREGRIRRTAWLMVRGFSLDQEEVSRKYVSPLATYLRFAMDRNTPLTALRYGRDNNWFEMWHSGIQGDRDDDRGNRLDVLLPRKVADLHVIERFLATYARTAPAGPALADMLTGGRRASLETMILELTTLVEGVHRSLFPDDRRMPDEEARRLQDSVKVFLSREPQRVQDIINGGLVHLAQPSYKMRLDRLWNYCASVIPEALGDKKPWVREVNKARNSFAHRDTGFLDDIQIDTFIALSESLRWLILITLLLDAGVDENALANRMQQHQRYDFSVETMKKYLPAVFGQ